MTVRVVWFSSVRILSDLRKVFFCQIFFFGFTHACSFAMNTKSFAGKVKKCAGVYEMISIERATEALKAKRQQSTDNAEERTIRTTYTYVCLHSHEENAARPRVALAYSLGKMRLGER